MPKSLLIVNYVVANDIFNNIIFVLQGSKRVVLNFSVVKFKHFGFTTRKKKEKSTPRIRLNTMI